MRRINSSTVALALSAVALFVALGGTAVAVSGAVSTSQIKNGAVTTNKLKNGSVTNHKIANGAVGNAKLANNSVGNAKLRNGSVSASKLAPGAVSSASFAAGSVSGTALASGSVGTGALADGGVTTTKLAASSVGTGALADNSVTTSKIADNAVSTTKLADASVTNGKLAPDAVTSDKVLDGSLTASDVAAGTFVQGNGLLESGRILVAPGTSAQIVSLGFADLEGNCPLPTPAKPTMSILPLVPNLNVVATVTTKGNPNATVTMDTENAIPVGNNFQEENTTGNPQTITWQIAYTDAGGQHVATVVTNGQNQGGTCVFAGQGTTTG